MKEEMRKNSEPLIRKVGKRAVLVAAIGGRLVGDDIALFAGTLAQTAAPVTDPIEHVALPLQNDRLIHRDTHRLRNSRKILL